MAKIKAFKAIRPIKDMASNIAALPYDVIESNEARELAKNNAYSFLHVDKAEIDLDKSIDIYDDVIYKKAKENLDNMIDSGVYIEEATPCMYIYRQIMNGIGQTGLVVCSSINDYLNNVIRKHELTREDKELDRIKHIDVCDANTGPIFLMYRENKQISYIIDEWMEKDPIYDFISEDGNTHTVWIIDDSSTIKNLEELFKCIKYLYIADGHHRSASAVKVGLQRRDKFKEYTGDEEFNYFLSILYSDSQLRILDYNRAVKDLNGLTEEEFLNRVDDSFNITLMDNAVRPVKKHTFGMYLNKKWYMLEAKDSIYDENNIIEQLDVSILQNNILKPILGIDDPRKSDRIVFIGGIRGLEELEEKVDNDMKVSFSMYPTTIDDIMKVADKGEVMPPKSTWFEPKPRSGLFIHKF